MPILKFMTDLRALCRLLVSRLESMIARLMNERELCWVNWVNMKTMALNQHYYVPWINWVMIQLGKNWQNPDNDPWNPVAIANLSIS